MRAKERTVRTQEQPVRAEERAARSKAPAIRSEEPSDRSQESAAHSEEPAVHSEGSAGHTHCCHPRTSCLDKRTAALFSVQRGGTRGQAPTARPAVQRRNDGLQAVRRADCCKQGRARTPSPLPAMTRRRHVPRPIAPSPLARMFVPGRRICRVRVSSGEPDPLEGWGGEVAVPQRLARAQPPSPIPLCGCKFLAWRPLPGKFLPRTPHRGKRKGAGGRPDL